MILELLSICALSVALFAGRANKKKSLRKIEDDREEFETDDKDVSKFEKDFSEGLKYFVYLSPDEDLLRLILYICSYLSSRSEFSRLGHLSSFEIKMIVYLIDWISLSDNGVRIAHLEWVRVQHHIHSDEIDSAILALEVLSKNCNYVKVDRRLKIYSKGTRFSVSTNGLNPEDIELCKYTKAVSNRVLDWISGMDLRTLIRVVFMTPPVSMIKSGWGPIDLEDYLESASPHGGASVETEYGESNETTSS